ncbi:MAG: hypothetical protein WCJ09_27735 [Planctomycetota bacterium]
MLGQSAGQPTFKLTSQGQELIQLVVTRLKARFGGQMRDIHIAVLRDGLVLRGRVGTYYGKQMAQEVATEVTGLTVRSNDIEVHAPVTSQHRRSYVS